MNPVKSTESKNYTLIVRSNLMFLLAISSYSITSQALYEMIDVDVLKIRVLCSDCICRIANA